MIETLRGIIIEKSPTKIIVETGGVGYGVFIPLGVFQTLPANNSEVFLYIHDVVREDTRELFGFLQPIEKRVFEHLITVPGVGPRLALRILNESPITSFVQMVLNKDTISLSKIKGLGEKTAAKVVLELTPRFQKDHLLSSEISPNILLANNDVLSKTEEALHNLGYKDAEIKRVISDIYKDNPPKTLEESIRKTLSSLSKR